ncbi:MAG: hypothetical protein JXQ23_08035 [Clostridia bacterium]|nr:hypothetical protein [Clostridia bacterium]
MIKIIINNEYRDGFKWHILNDIYVKGYAYVNDEYKEGKGLAEYFDTIETEGQFRHLMQDINGLFSVIIKRGEKVLAAVDRYGVFDLFYSKVNHDIFISDMVSNIISHSNQKKINIKGKRDFIYCGFICHGETLIENIYALNASKYLTADNEVEIKPYFELQYHVQEGLNYHDLKKSFDEVVHKVAKRFVSSLDGKEVYVPLSGGMDSRFILILLNKMNYKNVTCFTYGNALFNEKAIAKKVAEENGFKFIHLPYQRKLWKAFFKSHDNDQFLLYASNYQCMAHLMDYFAASEIDMKNCIVVPGHIGSIAGSYIDKPLTRDRMLDFFIHKYLFFYSRKNTDIQKYLKDRLEPYLNDFHDTDTLTRQNEIFDSFAYDTYRSKHLFKALKAYDYHNIEWRLPLMDNDIVSFMYSLDIRFKGNDKIFFGKYVGERISERVKFSKSSHFYLIKVLKNLFDRRYSCISYKETREMDTEGLYLPKGMKLKYRLYRNFLSFIALKNYFMIERNLHD